MFTFIPTKDGKVCLVLLALLIAGCTAQSDNTNKNTDVHQASVDAISNQEFFFLGDAYPTRKPKLTRDDIFHDTAVLHAALDRAYSGKEHLPSGVYSKLIDELWSLSHSLTLGSTDSDGDLFCSHLGLIFWSVPDSHLYVGSQCPDLRKKPEQINVGKNIHEGQGYFYEARIVNGKQIGLLSFGTSMPAEEDASWTGFEEKVNEILKDVDGLVLDLRGNHGGMSDNIRWLASRLYGNPAKMVPETILKRESVAVYALWHNENALDIIKARLRNQPVQDYLVKNKNSLIEKSRQLDGQPPGWSNTVRQGSEASFNPTTGFNKPVRILIDRGCASSCEGGFARFLSHPKIKTYGTNTFGAIHYGDTEPLVLPRSGVVVFIPVTFRAFTDGRFLEKIGYAPDVLVANGEDALSVAMQELQKLMSN